MKKSIFYMAGMLLLASLNMQAQTFTPIAVTGYVHDFVAEGPTSSLATTDTVLDGSAYVMYSQSFATAGGFSGGLPTNRIITDATNTHQFQLAPYDGPNMLNVMRNATRSFTLVTPATYQKLSILAFATEGSAQVTVTIDFVDGTSGVYANVTIPDWFAFSSTSAGNGYGRMTRMDNVTAANVNGYPTNPYLSYIDVTLNCPDRKKAIKAIRFTNTTTTGSNAPFPNIVIPAISGQTDTQNITSTTSASSCGSPTGSATLSITGNTGPYTVSWNTTPAVSGTTLNNVMAGTYTATVTDANSCTTAYPVTIAQLPSPTSITATATPATICGGSSTQLAVTATGGTLASYTWLPGNANTATVTVSPTAVTTYTVIGTDGAGCPYSRQVTVNVAQRPTAPTVPAIQVCSGNSGTIQVTQPQSGFTYNWYSAATGGTSLQSGPNFVVNNPTASQTYYVEASNGGCASTRTAVTLGLLPTPSVNAGQDVTIVAGETAQLNATASAGSYLWTPATGLSSATILNPTATVATTTTYTLTVTHAQGCKAADDVTVTVLPYCIKPMTAFTPNGDGINDVWRVTDGSCTKVASVEVFDRYGSKVYRSDNYNNDWNGTFDGKPLPDATYYFILNYQLVGGRMVYLKGTVTILR